MRSRFDPCVLPCSYFSISCNVIYHCAKRTDCLSRCAGNTTISIITYRKNCPCKNQFAPLTNALVKQLRQTLWAAWSVKRPNIPLQLPTRAQINVSLYNIFAAFCICITVTSIALFAFSLSSSFFLCKSTCANAWLGLVQRTPVLSSFHWLGWCLCRCSTHSDCTAYSQRVTHYTRLCFSVNSSPSPSPSVTFLCKWAVSLWLTPPKIGPRKDHLVKSIKYKVLPTVFLFFLLFALIHLYLCSEESSFFTIYCIFVGF